MEIENENKLCCSEQEHECGCENHQSSEKELSKDEDSAGCGCGCGCGCGDGPGDQYLTIKLEDESELECKILGIFGCGGHTYIAVFHPIEETVLIFRYIFNEDRTISVEDIEDDEEYEAVSKLFVAMHENQYEIIE